MKRIHRSICAFVCLCLMNGMLGCNMQGKKTMDPPSVEGEVWELWQRNREQIMPLSFYSSDGNRLLIQRTAVTIEEGEQRAEKALQLLLEGPVEDENPAQRLFESDSAREDLKIRLASVQISGNVANVNLYNESGGSSDDAALVKARTAIANTLTDYMGVRYVNIFFNGAPEAYQTLMLGAMERYDGNPENYLIQIRQQENTMTSHSVLATLYFPDQTGRKLLAEVRQIDVESMDNQSLANAILYELLEKGPRNTEHKQPPIINHAAGMLTRYQVQEVSKLDYGFIAEANAIQGNAEEGQNQRNEDVSPIKIQKRMTVQVLGWPSVEGLSEKALAASLMSVIDIQNAEISISAGSEDMALKANVVGTNDYVSDIGTLVPMYFPTKNMVELTPVHLPMDAIESENPLAILREMLRMANDSEDQALASPFPQGVAEEDFLDAFLSGKTAIVNMSQHLYERLQAGEEQEQQMFLYAIISTLTEVTGIENVQFFVEQDNVEMLGSFVIMAPLMPDRGKIVQATGY